MKKIILENENGEVIRTFHWLNGESCVLLIRRDTQRMGLYESTQIFVDNNIEFTVLAQVTRSNLLKTPLEIPAFGRLRCVDSIEKTLVNPLLPEETSRVWQSSVLGVAVGSLLFILLILNAPQETESLKEELREHVVKIVKRHPKRKLVEVDSSRFSKKSNKVKPTKKAAKSVKRMGALAVLGSLRKSSQRGGINLGAAKASRGPGLGGSKGSGGVQTSLYGKGLIAAPVGVGGRVKGAGGYGSKGKGGGQAGYGKLSLVGSSGTSTVPLGREAIVEGGLDKDLIAATIAKKMGQIRFCYEQGLQLEPSIQGRVAINFTISGRGRVKIAQVKNTTLHSKTVEDCILLRLRSWKFPEPQGGMDVKVSYPFMLRRTGRG